MTIEELRDQVKGAAMEYITTTAKEAVVRGLRGTVLPALQEVATPFVAQLKADAQAEKGWAKFRDGVFLPAVVSIAFWGVGKLLDKMEAATATERLAA